ncbi:hypothetical protein [Pseudomonas rhodesiae]|uniref:hypothetical protein n=1 Tax=Pseudomonas rhodesiae TaxID=76760 RepID=UPI0024DF69E3|nr:hypothetical protein [Pseudomonas rhodesiae]WHT75596.1 hypothetical protein QMY54_00331 [Pseudomonas rhodesiae]
MTAVKLSAGEEALIASIIEYIYPAPQAGTSLPVEPGEKRAARGLERKGLVVLGVDTQGRDQMTFTTLGQATYEEINSTAREGNSSISKSKLVRPSGLDTKLIGTIRAAVRTAEIATTCDWLVSEGYASDDSHARELIQSACST